MNNFEEQYDQSMVIILGSLRRVKNSFYDALEPLIDTLLCKGHHFKNMKAIEIEVER